MVCPFDPNGGLAGRLLRGRMEIFGFVLLRVMGSCPRHCGQTHSMCMLGRICNLDMKVFKSKLESPSESCFSAAGSEKDRGGGAR